jgi:hypothetical protein
MNVMGYGGQWLDHCAGAHTSQMNKISSFHIWVQVKWFYLC